MSQNVKNNMKTVLPITSHSLQKQRTALYSLLNDNQRLKDELMMENAFSTHPTSQTAKKLIQHLENQDDTYETLITEQLSVAENLLSRESQLKQDIEENRAAMGGIYRAEEVSVRAQRRIILLENRIHQAASAKSTAELQASQLRNHVDSLRQERRLFDELSDKMERSIAQQAQDISTMLKKIRETHTAQVRADAMKEQIKAQMDRDAHDAELEWKRLTEVIDKDRAEQVAEQARRAAERKKRMDEIIRRQKSIRSSSKSRANTQLQSPSATSSAASRVEEHSTVSSAASIDDNDDATTPRDKVQRLQAMIDAVVSAIAPHGTADEAIKKLEEQKQLCLNSFSALSDAHARIESMENSRLAAAAKNEVSSTTVQTVSVNSSGNGSKSTAMDHHHQSDTNSMMPIGGEPSSLDALCDHVQHLSERFRPFSTDINDTLNKDNNKVTSKNVLQMLGLIEQCINNWTQSCSSSNNTNDYIVNGQELDVGVIEPPSLASSDRSSSRWSAGSRGRCGRQSVTSSSDVSSNEGVKVLDMNTLAQRAQRSVAARFEASAKAVRVVASKNAESIHSLNADSLCSVLLARAMTSHIEILHNGNQRSLASEQLPLHQRFRSFRDDLYHLPETLKSLARVQLVATVVGIVSVIALSGHHGHWKLLQTVLPRLSTLFITSILTFEAFKEEDLFVWHQGSLNLKRLVILLQVFWIASEVIFASAFAPILLAISPDLLSQPLGDLIIRILPAATMVTLSSCFNFMSNLRRKRRRHHHHLSSASDGELLRLQSTSLSINSPRAMSCPIEMTRSSSSLHQPSPSPLPLPPLGFPTTTTPPPLSPADSWSSRSSGAIHSGLPSPTGHCQSPVRHTLDDDSSMHQHCDDIYLMQHTLDTNESMYFVHKKLKPIRTRSMNNVPITNNGGAYKPLLKTLMQESEARHAAVDHNNTNNTNKGVGYGPPKSVCSVTATITVVKPGKGTETHSTGGIPAVNTNFPITSLPVHL